MVTLGNLEMSGSIAVANVCERSCLFADDTTIVSMSKEHMSLTNVIEKYSYSISPSLSTLWKLCEAKISRGGEGMTDDLELIYT